MTEKKDKIGLYLPEIIAFFIAQLGLVIFFVLFMNFGVPGSISELNLMIYSFWIILAIPGLIGGLLTRNTTDGFESTFLSGILLFPILATGLLIIQGFILLNFLLILICGVIIGVYLGCFGYMGGWIGQKVFSYSRPEEKRSAFELLKRLIKGIIPAGMDKTGE
ncbi:MAG: hypothetical protein ACFFDT_02305 [Candidatus Hodarchaeota archaeon]